MDVCVLTRVCLILLPQLSKHSSWGNMQTVYSDRAFQAKYLFPKNWLILRNVTLFIPQAFEIYYLHLMKAKGLGT